MNTYLMLTRLSPGAAPSPASLEHLEKSVMQRIRADCPGVEWRASLAVLGPWDYVDIFDAPDSDTAFKVSTLVRMFGYAHTEVWTVQEWTRFKDMVRHLHVEATGRGQS
jgi:uncharacterized protein with GYD domain